jgi:hypothetical protein
MKKTISTVALLCVTVLVSAFSFHPPQLLCICSRDGGSWGGSVACTEPGSRSVTNNLTCTANGFTAKCLLGGSLTASYCSPTDQCMIFETQFFSNLNHWETNTNPYTYGWTNTAQIDCTNPGSPGRVLVVFRQSWSSPNCTGSDSKWWSEQFTCTAD